MSEEMNERYYMIVGLDAVTIVDSERPMIPAGTFTGPDRLLAAIAELNRLAGLGDQVNMPAETPAEFLNKRLPEVARRQRLESHLAEVTEIEEGLVRVLARDAANLKRATVLREKLEKELARPLSSTVTAQSADLVGVDTDGRSEALRRFDELTGFDPAMDERDLFKPQPY